MAWIAVVPPSPRHPHERYQVCYREGTRQRSAGVFPTKRRAEAERRAIERGRPELAGATDVDLEQKARTLLGEYVATKWWPAWKDQHPTSEYGTRKKVEKRILPTFGNIPLGQLDASTIGAWKSAMVAEQLSPQTVNTYLSLLGTILNAAVDDDYLPRSPLVRKSGAGRTAATRNQPVPRREVWLLREQLDRLVAAIDPRYRALVLVAALTGMRWGELAALRWDDPRFDQPLDDGAVRGPGRLRIARAISDPRRTGRGFEKGPRPRPASGSSPSIRRRCRRSWLTGSWSAAGLMTASSPAQAALAVQPGQWRATTSTAFGSEPWSRPSWPTCGPSTAAGTSTTYAISMPPG
jgi:integrase